MNNDDYVCKSKFPLEWIFKNLEQIKLLIGFLYS